MGKRKKTKAIKGESHLPEPIIQHIQFFLTGKEAAQTTILSKSWRDAWLTRPNLSFDEGDFHTQLLVVDRHSSIFSSNYSDSSSDSSDCSDSSSDRVDRRGDDFKMDEFLNFAKMTIQRYEQSNLKIETLRLRIFSSFWRSNGSNVAHDLIVRALKIGVTHLSLQVDYKFVFPREVFESGNLVELSVEGGKIDLKMDQKVICLKLESLSLSKLKIKREMISKIISNCPSIKKLSLARIRGSGYLNLPK